MKIKICKEIPLEVLVTDKRWLEIHFAKAGHSGYDKDQYLAQFKHGFNDGSGYRDSVEGGGRGDTIDEAIMKATLSLRDRGFVSL